MMCRCRIKARFGHVGEGKGNCRSDDDTIIMIITTRIIRLFQRWDSKNQGIRGTSSGTYTDSVAGASICMSLCAVSTKGSDLDHKPTLPPRLFPIAFRIDTHTHRHTHPRTLTPTHPHTHTHTPIHPHTQKTHRGQMMINVRKCNCVGLTGALANLERETSERSSFVGLHDPGSNH